MNRNILLANRLREVYINGHWIANTNYTDQLSNLDWKQATYKIQTLNTIAALTFHINYYLDGLLHAFDEGKLNISDKYSFDVPEIASEIDWANLRTSLLRNAEKFITRIETCPGNKLDENFLDERYGTYLRNIEGVLEHSYYHLGQISLLKKMILAELVEPIEDPVGKR